METKLPHLLSCILLLLLCNSSSSLAAMDFLKPLLGAQRGNLTEGLSQLKIHLSKLGYLNKPSSSQNDDVFDEALHEALIKYQSFFKLRPTGSLDAGTLAHIRQPRCGVPDVFPGNSSGHFAFFPGNRKWPAGRRNLSYSFPAGTRGDALHAIRAALDIWALVSPFKFRYIANYEAANIQLSFEKGGRLFTEGALAYAFPPTDGRVRFNWDVKWVDGVVKGAYDLQTVGLHELGHVLGLAHSQDDDAVMFPRVGSGSRQTLGRDDIDGIRTLYQS